MKGVIDSKSLYIGAMADSLHTSIMASTWSTTIRMGATKKRRVGRELVTFQYPEYLHWYYFAHHAVDDNNNNRQGCLPFETSFSPKDWNQRQFGFIFTLSVTNTYLAYNYFVRELKNKHPLAKGEYSRMLAKEMVSNPEWQRETKNQDTPKRNKQGKVEHELITLPLNCGKWQNGGFPRVKQLYQKYRCEFLCGRKCRTYCSCTKIILCQSCYAVHYAEHI